MRPVWARLGRPDPEQTVADLVAEHGTTVRDSLTETLGWLDPEGYLLAAGVSAEDLAAVRLRLGPG
jgi:protein-tyrosine phosphatase